MIIISCINKYNASQKPLMGSILLSNKMLPKNKVKKI